MGDDTGRMLPWLGAAARDARKRADRKQVHIAAELSVSEATIGKFERGKQWPRDPDATIGAYARDLELDPLTLWADAIQRWTRSAESP